MLIIYQYYKKTKIVMTCWALTLVDQFKCQRILQVPSLLWQSQTFMLAQINELTECTSVKHV